MHKNQNLHKAKKEKNDEFYTQLIDIEREMMHYTTHLNGKTIYCNCDSPNSQFVHYFKENFDALKLKKLVATSFNPNGQGTYLEYDGKTLHISNLMGSGDFRSVECSNLLKEADIVITNPPFSLFREFIAQLEVFNKSFIVIGHQNAITYKEIFKLIKENKLWLGYGFKGNVAYFINYKYINYAKSGNHKEYMIRVSGVKWFTNLPIQKLHKILTLSKTYNPIDYPKYDHYDAINVNKTKDIPKDYPHPMGVPLTFMDKYNPTQFEIIDALNRYSVLQGKTEETKGKYLQQINGKPLFSRIIIKHKQTH